MKQSTYMEGSNVYTIQTHKDKIYSCMPEKKIKQFNLFYYYHTHYSKDS